MKRLAIAMILTGISATGAHAMDVATFLTRMEALRGQGTAAMVSAEGLALQAEIRTSANAVRRERALAVRSGRRPAYCPPPDGGLSPQEIQLALMRIPVAMRPRTELRDAIRAAFASKYPCRA